jgi:O-methyltransferase involved in polyketide biosynthesis
MTDRVSVKLGNVQKTLFLPLWGRAVESKKNNPLLFDETAVNIIEQVDFDFTQMAKNLDQITMIAWIEQSLICDREVKSFLTSYPEGTIVNIGCGLDTTFERVDNEKLRWYDLDLPDVVELRSKFIAQSERRKFIAASFLEKEWLNEIGVQENVLFSAAGVFNYFTEREIQVFVLQLLDKYPGSELLFDVCSPTGMRTANKIIVESFGLDEKSNLTWGLKDNKDLLGWDTRIELIGTYYFRTLRIGIRNFLMGSLADYLGIQYMLDLRLGVIK